MKSLLYMAAWPDRQDGGSDRTAQTVLHGYPPLCSLIWALLGAIHPSKAKEKHPLGQSSTRTRYPHSKVSSEEREQDSKATFAAPSKDAKSTQVLCHSGCSQLTALLWVSPHGWNWSGSLFLCPLLLPPSLHQSTLWEELTILLGTEGISPVLLEVGSGAAPEVPICAPFGGAGIEGPSIVGERQDTGLPIRIATVRLGHGFEKENHSIRLQFKAIPKSQDPKTATAPPSQVTGCWEPTVTAMEPGQRTPTDSSTAEAFFYILFQTYIMAAPFE